LGGATQAVFPVTLHYADDRVSLYHGDCIEVMRTLPDASVDAIVTDPPYGLSFMGKDWDNFAGSTVGACEECGNVDPQQGYRYCTDCMEALDEAALRGLPMLGHQSQNWNEKATHSRGYADNNNAAFQRWCFIWATEALRVLKPGGHLLAFGGTRTWHRLAVAIEDAGFEVRDSIAWMYGSGFPKSHDVSKGIDKAAGAQREVVGVGNGGLHHKATVTNLANWDVDHGADGHPITAPATPAALQWQGWGTALKPAFEPIVVARKPLIGTVAANVLTHGTGALNIDGCRIGTDGGTTKGNPPKRQSNGVYGNGLNGGDVVPINAGRWPANVILDESQAAALDKQSGVSVSPKTYVRNVGTLEGDRVAYANIGEAAGAESLNYNDTGGASRFFYTAKANSSERPNVNGVAHPTVKPMALMQYLVRLVTPPGGTVLEPFAGSGTTIEAALNEGFNVIGIEMTDEYLPLNIERIERHGEKLW
jgi:site-specific DNA-methyltransferase (adenine-specific)